MMVDEGAAKHRRAAERAREAAWREAAAQVGGHWPRSTVRVAPSTGHKLAWSVLGVLVLVLILLIVGAGVRPEGRDAGPGRPAPAFALPRLGSADQYGSRELQGRLAVVTFWASWCEPCAVEARLVERVWQRYREQGVTVLGVTVDEDEREALSFVKRHGLTYPNVRDSGPVASAFRLQGMPEMYFLAESSTIESVHRGFPITVDERHGWVIHNAIYEPILERRIAGLLATRWRATTTS